MYVNGRRAIRARSPNEFYYYVRDKAGPVVDPATGKREPMPNGAFVADPKDIAPLTAMSKEQSKDALVVFYHSWESSVSRVAAVDPQNGTVQLVGNAPWPCNMWGPNQRYHIENFKAALDAPGEWFLDRGGDLFYIPLPGEDPAKAEVVAPVLSGLVRFAGDPDQGHYVEYITLKGLSFQHDQYRLPPQGHGDSQAAVTMPTAIKADGTRNIVLVGGEVAHVGGYAIGFFRGCAELPRRAMPDSRPGRRRRPHRARLGATTTLGGRCHRTLHRRQQHHPLRRTFRPRHGSRLYRPQRLQPGNAQRHRRFPLHRRLRRLGVGLCAQPGPPQHASISTTSITSAGA